MKNLMKQTGIYLVYPTSEELESIYKPKGYKTMVSNQHSKLGITQKSFKSRKKCYTKNFEDVVFKPLVIVDSIYLKSIEKEILNVIKNEFNTVGYSREWIDSTNRTRITEIVRDELVKSRIPHIIVS